MAPDRALESRESENELSMRGQSRATTSGPAIEKPISRVQGSSIYNSSL